MRVKTIVLLAVNGFLLICLLIAYIVYANLGSLLQSQLAGERFSGGEERFAQLSCFFPDGTGFTFSDVWNLRESLEAKFVEASLEAPEGGTLMSDAYSFKGQLTVKAGRNTVTTTAIAVGGDFFSFHPLRLKSGSYIKDSDVMRDRVILDENLAWQLFGSSDVAGMEVEIDGGLYIVAGVVAREDDYASKKALESYLGSSQSCIFVCYEILSPPDTALFDCYEVVLPEPINGFAEDLLKGTSFVKTGAELVKNTGRFGFFETFDTIADFGNRTMRTSPVTFPYWENAALVNEDYMALVMVFMFVLVLVPLVTLVIVAVKLMRKTKGQGRVILDKADRLRERLHAYIAERHVSVTEGIQPRSSKRRK